MEESPFKENDEPIMSNDTKAQKELDNLKITTSKYKNLVIDGVTIPSIVLTTSSEAPYSITKPRNVGDVTSDERNWLMSNINFIMTDAGDFIPVSSGNQLAFYQTLLRICYFIVHHNIPIDVIPKEKEFKLLNICQLIEDGQCDTSYEPEFKIDLSISMKSNVSTKGHALVKYNNFVKGVIRGELVNYVSKNTHYVADVVGNITFNDIDMLKNYFDRILSEDPYPGDNNIFKLLADLKPIYLNNICKTTDTFSFYANPKAWIAKTKLTYGPECAFNIIIKPKFVGDINLTTWHANFKDIELKMEQLSNKIKKLTEKYVFKK
ncbi:MAG: hypothetical protein HDQ88_04760 [Clostridia bacterium]|nr:hypothetical protein [Clostridia bacterium]